MARFRKAGLILAGTTTTPEFGYNAATEAVIYGATRNPWNLNHSPWFEWWIGSSCCEWYCANRSCQ